VATADQQRWDDRYAGRDLAEPTPPDALAAADLTGLVPTTGHALDVACGLGAQSVWLAQRGLEVVSLDVSNVAIDATRRLAAAHQLEQRVDARQVDLDAGLPADVSGLDTVVCQRFRGVDLYPQLVDRLRVGGLLVLTVLSEVGADSPGPFHAPPGELIDAFTPLRVDVIHHVEADGQASLVAHRT
jgi:SAM-dependent methyltransferase